MRSIVFAAVFAYSLAAGPLEFRESAFVAAQDGKPAGWTTWSARAETAPRCFVDAMHFRGKPGSLAISGNSNIAEHGGWERAVAGIEGKTWFLFIVYYRAEGVTYEPLQVVARLDWRDAKEHRTGQP